VTVRWEDVNARAKGLATRLLSPEAIAGLAGAGDLRELSRALAGLGVLSEEVPDATAPVLELALRRAAARELGLARRWLGPRADVVAVALEAEDRRSLRALVRGAAAGVHAEARLTGLMPTPTLPERLLRELAGRSSIRDQAALLVAAGHPAGPPLLAAAAPQEPDLFAVELAIARAFAERAIRGGRRGGKFLREYVGDLIDAENCRTALLLARRIGGEPPGSAFIAGGRRLTRERFERAASAGDPVSAARLIGEALGGGAEATLLLRHADAPTALEAALEEHETDRLVRAARLDPLGPAPVLLYLRRLRAQTVALGEVVWGLDLEVARRGGGPVAAGSGAA
jgi:vacuolar-type H+-ATPase subunit C/Vma6